MKESILDGFMFNCTSTIAQRYDEPPTVPATNFLIHCGDLTTELSVNFCTAQQLAYLPAFVCIDNNYIVESFHIDQRGFHLVTDYDDGADVQGEIDLVLSPPDWTNILKKITFTLGQFETTLINNDFAFTGRAAIQLLELYKLHGKNSIVKTFSDDLQQNKIGLNYALEKTKPLRADPIFQNKINFFLTEFVNQNGQDKPVTNPRTGKKKSNRDAICSYFFYRKKAKLKHSDAINHVIKIYPQLSFDGLSEQIKRLTKTEKAEFNATV